MLITRCRIALLMSCISLASCAVGPDFKQPTPPQVKSYTPQPLSASTIGFDKDSQHFIQGQDIPAKWWLLFSSPELNDLIRVGLQNSPNLQAGMAALRKAQENANAEFGSVLYPSVSASLTGQRQRLSNTTFGDPNAGGSVFNLYNASVNVSYNIDFFGGGRRAIESLAAQVDYQRFVLEATYLSLTANIMTTAIAAASLQAQVEATKESLTAQEKQLNLMQQQLKAGGISEIDLLAQQARVAQTRASIPGLEKNYAQTRHSLSILTGLLPSEDDLPIPRLDSLQLPAELPLSIPADLIKQRPDVAASAALLHAASAQIGIVTAEFFPALSLQGSKGSESNIFHQILKANTNVWSIEAQLLQPIFNGGSLMAKRRASIAAYEQSSAEYRATVLQAFQNVADSLRALEKDANALQAQQTAEQAAHKRLQLAEKQYQVGAISFIELLSAEQDYQQMLVNRIQAQTLRYTDTVALFQALGGGWWNRKHDISFNETLEKPQ